MEHEHHDHHAMQQTTIKSDDSCCSDTDGSKSSGQHMMHHMMSVSYITFCVVLNKLGKTYILFDRCHSILVLMKLCCLIGGNFQQLVV